MKIGLFIPCFMNELYPDICKATYQVLKRQGLNVEYPLNQTCCGQPMANSGCSKDVKNLAINFVNTFKEFDYIVRSNNGNEFVSSIVSNRNTYPSRYSSLVGDVADLNNTKETRQHRKRKSQKCNTI